MEYDADNAENFVSLKMLKSNMKDALKRSGVLSSVKAQVRREFISNLAPSGVVPREESTIQLSEQELLFRCAVFHFLRSKKYDYTLSVYTAECGVEGREMLSEAEVASRLHVQQRQNNGTSANSSPLEIIMGELRQRAEAVCVEVGTQSDYSGAGIREMLDCRMGEISRTFEAKKEHERLFPNKGFEEKMIAFQRDCEKRMREDLEAQMKTFREVEISKVRLEEAHKARMELEAMRTELESSFERRMLLQTEREADSLRAAADRERQLQQAQYEARQRLQRELDDLRAREQNACKKVELDSQGLRLLESRIKESQVLLESREKELGRREREAEHAFRDATEKAREEAHTRLREELEGLIRERSGLKTERTRLDADREAWDSVVADAAAWRSKCTELETTVALKDEEIISLKHRIARLDFRQKLEITEIAELTGMVLHVGVDEEGAVHDGERMIPDPFSSATKAARTQHLLGLIQRNAELDARVRLLEELEREGKSALTHERELRKQTQVLLQQKQDELDRVVTFSKDFTIRVENERRRGHKEIEKLRKQCAVEKGRVVVATSQRAEIENLVREQRDAISKLQKTHKSMGHVKSIRDNADERDVESDSPKSSNAATTNKIQAGIAAELEWLRSRRVAIESSVDGGRNTTKTPAITPGGSFIYGHGGITPVSASIISIDTDINPNGQSTARDISPNLDSQQQLLDLKREEERMRREFEDIEKQKHDVELKRIKDMLKKQNEENELNELRRSSEKFAEKLRQQKEEELAEKERELARREEALLKAREAEKMDNIRKSEEDLRIAAANDRAKASAAFDETARRNLEEAALAAKTQQEEEARAASQLQLKQQQQQQQEDDRRERARLAEQAEEKLEAERLADQRTRDEVVATQRDLELKQKELLDFKETVSKQEQLHEDEKSDADAVQHSDSPTDQFLDGKLPPRDDGDAAEEQQKKKESDDATTARVKQEEEIEQQRLLAEEEVKQNAIKEEKVRTEELLRIDREIVADEGKKRAEEEAEREEEEERRRVAEAKRTAAREEADRLRQAAKEEEEEKQRNRQLEEAAKEEEEKQRNRQLEEAAKEEEEKQRNRQLEEEEILRRRDAEEEEEEIRQKEQAEREAELEAQRKKEEDSNALQAARAKVLARRKQRQDRDSVESLTSDGTTSVRNSQSLPAFSAPKPEENDMSNISEIEVAKPTEQSHSDDDIWF